VLSLGAASIVSDVARLPARETNQAGTVVASADPSTQLPAGFLRVLLYSPNLVNDDYPSFAWDVDLEMDGQTFFIGTVRRRCEVIEKRFVLPATPRTVQMRLHRLRLAPIRSSESELLAQHTLELLQDPTFNPRGGSVPLQLIAEETYKRSPNEYKAVVGREHLGSFRAFIGAHTTRFSIFHYHESEIESRKISNVTPYDERVAIRKGVRESLPPLMPFGNNEAEVVSLLQEALRECDSHVHVLMRQLSKYEVFRVSMAPGFSSLMHWLQRHRDLFCWSTDPQSVCTIGLVRDRSHLSAPRLMPPTAAGEEDSDDSDVTIGSEAM
jgi:hypothetical protein